MFLQIILWIVELISTPIKKSQNTSNCYQSKQTKNLQIAVD